MSFIPIYILILALTIVVDYFAGIWIDKSEGKQRKLLLLLSIITNIGILAVFKYANFIVTNANDFLHHFSIHNPMPLMSIILPIGLSFHTFQAMSYTIEVYRGNQKPEKHFGIYALYVMFYPQLVAGPIERPQNLLPQFRERHNFDFDRFKEGFTQILFGLFKKVVIADRLALAVDYSYGNISSQSGLSLALATFFYSFQIYCDFSGYSDIAIGTAKIMGFRLMNNFNTPYFSKSISEFWSRWHISLSTWFRDYLYFPLGGNRVRIPRWFFNLFIVFILSGLWHGANWTFIAWGAANGFLLIVTELKNIFCRKYKMNIPSNSITNAISIGITFSLVCLTWIFFRAADMSSAFNIFHKIFSLSMHDSISLYYYRNELIFCFVLILLLCVKEKFWLKINVSNTPRFVIISLLLIFTCYFFGVFNQTQFIYFQF